MKCTLFPEQAVVHRTRKCPTLRWGTVPGAFVLHCISHLSGHGDPDIMITKPHVHTYTYVYIYHYYYFRSVSMAGGLVGDMARGFESL